MKTFTYYVVEKNGQYLTSDGYGGTKLQDEVRLAHLFTGRNAAISYLIDYPGSIVRTVTWEVK